MVAHTQVPIEVAFVDKIDAAPTVRLSLTNAPWKVGRGFDLSPPPLRRTVSSSMLADGARYPAAAFDNRTIGLPLTLRSDNAPAALADMANLARELNRPTNVLRVKIGSTYVFYRTFRAPDYVLSQVLGLYQVDFFDVHLPAEPFGYGLRVNLGPYTINNDPAAGTNPQYVDLPTVTGDVETPAYIFTTSVSTVTSTTLTRVPMLVVNHGDTVGTFSAGRVVQAESALALLTDTTLPGNDAAMSGAGSNYVRVSFATDTSMVTRFTHVGPNLEAGRYTVLARVRRSVGGDVVKMRFGQDTGSPVSNPCFQPAITLPAGTTPALVVLGVVQFPFGSAMRENGYSGAVINGTGQILIDAQRVSGTGNLDIDYLLFVPANYATLTASLPPIKGSAGINSVAWDGVGEVVRELTNADPFNAAAEEKPALVALTGKFPTLLPGGVNRLHVLRDVGSDAPNDSIAATAAISVAYWPRYLVTP